MTLDELKDEVFSSFDMPQSATDEICEALDELANFRSEPDAVAEILNAGAEFIQTLEGAMDRGVAYALLVHMRKRAYELGRLK